MVCLALLVLLSAVLWTGTTLTLVVTSSTATAERVVGVYVLDRESEHSFLRHVANARASTEVRGRAARATGGDGHFGRGISATRLPMHLSPRLSSRRPAWRGAVWAIAVCIWWTAKPTLFTPSVPCLSIAPKTPKSEARRPEVRLAASNALREEWRTGAERQTYKEGGLAADS